MTDEEILRFLDLRSGDERFVAHQVAMHVAADVAGAAGMELEASVYGDVRDRQVAIHVICGRYEVGYPAVLSALSSADRVEVECLVAG